jgi:hypothetical protein
VGELLAEEVYDCDDREDLLLDSDTRKTNPKNVAIPINHFAPEPTIFA